MIENKAKFSTADLKKIFGASRLLNIEDDSLFTGVSTDSRQIKNQEIFVALSGENFDGHNKVIEAFEKGAGVALVSASKADKLLATKPDLPLIVCENSLHGLGMLARYHRLRFNFPVIAICGSNGKTSTKNFTAHLLEQKYKVLKTYGNFNNQIGVSLMLLQMNDDYDVVVLEIGTNEPGEISLLSNTAMPTHGIITNIGREHLEKLIDLDGIEKEETALFDFLDANDGVCLINADDSRLAKHVDKTKKHLTFGNKTDFDIQTSYKLDSELRPELLIKYAGDTIQAKLKTQGYTTALNAFAAVAVAFSLGLSKEEIVRGLETYEIELGAGYARMLIEKIGSMTLINDCYNANPDSMTAALKTLELITSADRKIAIIADMLELGSTAVLQHTDILEQAVSAADRVIVFGDNMCKACAAINNTEKIMLFADKQELIKFILFEVQDNDALLVKGSRGMRMEEVVNAIKENDKLL
ncbi:MAG: UDP-N-acetylmuramoyl-tripeptide--D-alanyl-D-alanine ligase [Candidatus Kapabacteria bacterium]|nr:UDP-N-acetylmuramoyl-tripeptide--D-alanyl-D-alanine ligase [Candidatus Kapabacteria bacterium]